MMKVHFLGTSGWFDSSAGSTVCAIIDAPDCYIILDAGMGLHKADTIITESKPIFIFLSHFHLDHTAGLHVLGKFRFNTPVEIYGPPGTEKYVGAILDHPFTIPAGELPYPVSIHDLDRQTPRGVTVKFAPLVHSTICYGYRFEFLGRSICYCTDTGLCDGLAILAKDAELFICECSFRPDEEVGTWPHLRPEDAATVARSCLARRLVLTHFDASRYQDEESRAVAQKRAQKIFPATIAAADDMCVKLP